MCVNLKKLLSKRIKLHEIDISVAEPAPLQQRAQRACEELLVKLVVSIWEALHF